MMKIKILGTRGRIQLSAPLHSKHSGILLDGKLMLDIGEKVFLKYKPKWIILTHLHNDHAIFVDRKINTEILYYGPEKFNDMVEVFSNVRKFGKYKVTPVPTSHSLRFKSQGYIIESGKSRIFYSGDLFAINKKYLGLLKKIDLVITEASFIKRGGLLRRDEKGNPFGHAGIPDLIKIFKPYTQNILLVHFGSWFYKDIKKAEEKIEELGKELDVNVLTGYDGMELTLESDHLSR